MRVWILGGGLALALTAAASEDPINTDQDATAADSGPRTVTLRWRTTTIAGGKDAAMERALGARGMGSLAPPPAAPLRAWMLPDGSEVIAHEPPAALSRQRAGEHLEQPR